MTFVVELEAFGKIGIFLKVYKKEIFKTNIVFGANNAI